MIRQLLLQYGYIVIFGGCFLEGETILVLGGISAKLGYLDLAGVILAATAGSFLGDQLYFQIGRRYGHRLLARLPSWQPRADRVTRLLDRYDTWFILGFRFVYGLRTASPFVLGMSGVRQVKFTVLNFVAAAVWAIVVSTLGYVFGEAIALLLDKAIHYERFILEATLVAGFLIWVVYLIRDRRRTRAAAQARSADDEIPALSAPEPPESRR